MSSPMYGDIVICTIIPSNRCSSGGAVRVHAEVRVGDLGVLHAAEVPLCPDAVVVVPPAPQRSQGKW